VGGDKEGGDGRREWKACRREEKGGRKINVWAA